MLDVVAVLDVDEVLDVVITLAVDALDVTAVVAVAALTIVAVLDVADVDSVLVVCPAARASDGNANVESANGNVLSKARLFMT